MAMGRQFSKFGQKILLANSFQTIRAGGNGVRVFSGEGFPKSGTYAAGGTGFDAQGNGAPPHSIYIDESTGVQFYNGGSITTPYWTPVGYTQRNLFGWYTDFRDGQGKAVSDTAASATIAGSGLRIHGQSIPDTDAGLTVAHSFDGSVASLITGNEDPDVAAVSFGTGTTNLFKPSANGTIVIDAHVAQSAAITARSCFVGFCSSAADALAQPVTGATVTLSFAATSGDDIAGLFFGTDLTVGNKWMAPYVTGDAAATQLVAATGVATDVTVAAAGTYQRLRTEIDANGAVRNFIDKVMVSNYAAATMTPGSTVHPVIVLAALDTSNVTMLIKSFAAWGVRT